MKATSSIASITHPSQNGVMLYNGRPYAVGLLWLTVQEDTQKGLLQERIKKTGADFYCLRQHISQQQGFGWMEKGHRRGMQAAAAMLADQLVGEWHAVFEADNGWWYVQVRSDTITPNGDLFFASEEDAFQHFQDEAQKNIWPHAYAPEKWSLQDANTRELSLKSMLDGLATTTLTPANITATFGSALVRNVVLGGLLLAFVIMAGILALSLTNTTEDIPSPSAPIRTVQPATLSAPKATVVETISPKQLLEQCGDAAGQLYLAIPGWKAQNFDCSAGKAAMGWQQGKGSLSTAKNAGMAAWPPGVAVTFTNRVMTAMMSLGNLPKLASETLWPQEEILLYLEQYLQPMGNLQIKPVIPSPPPRQPGTAANAPLPPTPPPYLEIQFLSGYDPGKIVALLQGPGLELLSVQWTIPRGTWQYKMKWTYQPPAPRTNTTTGTPTGAAARGPQR